MPDTLHIIAPSYAPGQVGGAEVVFLEITRELIRRDHPVQIHLNPPAADYFPEWEDFIRIIPAGPMTGSMKGLSVLRLQWASRKTFPRDGICWFPFGAAFPGNFRGKALTTIHDALEKDYPASISFPEKAFRAWNGPATRKNTRILTSSQFSAGRLKHHYGVDAMVIRPGSPQLPEPSHHKAPDEPFVFYPANAWPHKNHTFLLNLWTHHPQLHSFPLVFTMSTGTGSLSPAIEKARQAGVEIKILGHVTRSELAGLYQKAHCTVFPSLYEGFGLPLHESLACNCPILISNQAALPEAVHPDYPFCLSLDEERWAEIILQNPRSFLSNPRAFIPSWTWKQATDEFLKAVQTVAA